MVVEEDDHLSNSLHASSSHNDTSLTSGISEGPRLKKLSAVSIFYYVLSVIYGTIKGIFIISIFADFPC